MDFMSFFNNTAIAHLEWGNLVMILVGVVFIYLAVAKDYEPLLLVPIGFGIIVGNIPPIAGMPLGVYSEGSVLSFLYFGVTKGIYPPLIFLGIGAMTDFSTMLSNPKLILLGAAAQLGVFLTFLGALFLGFSMKQAGAIGIHHRRRGRPDGDLPRLHDSTGTSWSHCDCRLLLYGPCAGYPATGHVSSHHKGRTQDPHETASQGQQKGEDHLSRCRLSHLHADRPGRHNPAGHAFLRQSPQREHGDGPAGKLSPQCPD